MELCSLPAHTRSIALFDCGRCSVNARMEGHAESSPPSFVLAEADTILGKK